MAMAARPGFLVICVFLPALARPADLSDPTRPPAPAAARGPRVRFRPGDRADVIRRAAEGMARRLDSTACQAVLDDFSDAEGTKLGDRLAASGVTLDGYLGQLFLYDGYAVARCQRSTTLAVTTPGSRVIFLCPQFVHTQLRTPAVAEAVLIHEMLLSLGLHENPPSSNQITAQVHTRCGR